MFENRSDGSGADGQDQSFELKLQEPSDRTKQETLQSELGDNNYLKCRSKKHENQDRIKPAEIKRATCF